MIIWVSCAGSVSVILKSHSHTDHCLERRHRRACFCSRYSIPCRSLISIPDFFSCAGQPGAGKRRCSASLWEPFLGIQLANWKIAVAWSHRSPYTIGQLLRPYRKQMNSRTSQVIVILAPPPNVSMGSSGWHLCRLITWTDCVPFHPRY